jgi:hypothetical protein
VEINLAQIQQAWKFLPAAALTHANEFATVAELKLTHLVAPITRGIFEHLLDKCLFQKH